VAQLPRLLQADRKDTITYPVFSDLACTARRCAYGRASAAVLLWPWRGGVATP